MSALRRKKAVGRFRYKCRRCGWYIKARGVRCYTCIGEILDGVPVGTFHSRELEREREARRERRNSYEDQERELIRTAALI